MHTEKLSISLPVSLTHFIDAYRSEHACKSRSAVIQEALKLLLQKELEQYYRAAASEVELLFETTADDGVDDEMW